MQKAPHGVMTRLLSRMDIPHDRGAQAVQANLMAEVRRQCGACPQLTIIELDQLPLRRQGEAWRCEVCNAQRSTYAAVYHHWRMWHEARPI